MERAVGRYNQFKRAVDNVRDGSWSIEEFNEFLVNIYESLSAKAQEVRDMLGSEEYATYQDDNGAEVDNGLAGMELYEAGMQEMALFLEDGEQVHLDEGLALMWEGNEKINEAMRINRESRDNIDLAFVM